MMNTLQSLPSFLFFPSFLFRCFVLPVSALLVIVLPGSIHAQDCVEVTGHELTCEPVFNAPSPIYMFNPVIKSHSDYGQSVRLTVFNAQNKLVGTFYSAYSSIPKNFEITPSLFIGGAFPNEQLTAHITLFDGHSRSTSTDSCESIYTFTLSDSCTIPVSDCVEPLEAEAVCMEGTADYVEVSLRVRNLTSFPLSGIYITGWDAVWGPVKPYVRTPAGLGPNQTSNRIAPVEIITTNYTDYPVPFVIVAVKGIGDSIIDPDGLQWEKTSKCITKMWVDIPDCRPSSVTDRKESESGTEFSLGASTPNPVTDQIRMSLHITAQQRVTIVVRDINGREVLHLLENELVEPGTHTVNGDLSSLPSGTYFCTLEGVQESRTRIITIIR